MSKKYSSKKPILLDVDGVVGNFVQHCLNCAKEAGVSNVPGIETVLKDTREYSWWDKANLSQIALQQGFCSNIPLISGSQEFVESLRSKGHHVVFLTSPYKDHEYWHRERHVWLEKNFNIKRTELIFATNKQYVNGLTLIDDHVKNILDWQTYQERDALMIATPWNQNVLEDCEPCPEPSGLTIPHYTHKKNMKIYRTNNWDEILDFVEMLSLKE